ncbi:nmrA-like family domain-containing protein [Ditylenchus destructor]|uniref:NmrA-like family domain-containing protein 1 n=1 Tax=Ditylenchus destructor TaxID=166010 RepID=A0AAD4QV55_9BILA|nr:nmrA-like family domain-containing protein [Ditylenchus destructor]
MDSVYGVFSVQPYSANEIQQGVARHRGGEAAGRQPFRLQLSRFGRRRDRPSPLRKQIKVEEHLRSSGLAYTIVRPVFFMENWYRGFGESIRSGQLQQPLSSTARLQMVAVDDIGAFVALAFEHPGKWKDRIFSLAGDELSMQQIADAFDRANSREVKYVQVSWDQFEKNMGGELTMMYHWFEEKGFHFNIDEVRREYPLTTPLINGWIRIGIRLRESKRHVADRFLVRSVIAEPRGLGAAGDVSSLAATLADADKIALQIGYLQ